jgi:hypothetical protein
MWLSWVCARVKPVSTTEDVEIGVTCIENNEEFFIIIFFFLVIQRKSVFREN